MKISKKILAAVAALMVCGSAFAQTAKNVATAGTILDDGDRLVNVLRWKDSEFDKNLVFGKVGLKDSVAVGFGTKAIKDSFLGAYYEGDLWGDAADSFSVLYGKDQLGLALGFVSGGIKLNGVYDTLPLPPGYAVPNVDYFGMSVAAGYTMLDGDLDLSGDFMLGFAREDDSKYTLPMFDLGVDYRFVNKDNLKFFAGLDFSFVDFAHKDKMYSIEYSYDYTTTVLVPHARLEAGLGKDVKYVGMVDIPFIFFGGKSKVDGHSETMDAKGFVAFNVANGISISILKGKADFNMGINTSLPAYNFDDEKTETDFTNSYYLGSTFNMTDAIKLGLYAEIFEDADTEESFDDVWNTEFGFTVQVQF